MKNTTIATTLILLFWSPCLIAAPFNMGARSKPLSEPAATITPAATTAPSDDAIQVGGDTFATATVIPSLPYTDTGNTCGFTANYVPPCISSAAARDVVYRFTPTMNMTVDVSVCDSNYDSALHMYQNSIANLVACNDDLCGSTGQQSRLYDIQLLANQTYYIVVDGFVGSDLSSCGDYTIEVTASVPCEPFSCPPGAIVEGEPTCSNGYVDNYNGGCNLPLLFTDIPCDTAKTTVCGEYGTYLFGSQIRRDTDWYRITVTEFTTIRACVTGEAPSVVLIGKAGICPGTFDCFALPSECETGCCELTVAPGVYWIVVATADFVGVPCGSKYLLEVECLPPEPQSTCVVRSDANANCEQDAVGNLVTVQGVVLAWKEFGNRGPGRIQDPESGCCIAIFDIDTAPAIPPGWVVRVTGWTGPFFGLDELVDDPSTGTNPQVTVLGMGDPAEPLTILAADMTDGSATAEDLESCLVRMCGTFTQTGSFAGDTNYTFVDTQDDTCAVRVDIDTNIDGTPIPTTHVALTGIFGQFDRTGPSSTRVPCTGYQLLPRSLADFAECRTSGIGEEEHLSTPPGRTVLYQNQPNPFNPRTTIRFDLARGGHVALKVYDVSGRLVRVVFDNVVSTGRHSVVWNGLDADGRQVGSGLYFYRLEGDDFKETRRMVVLK